MATKYATDGGFPQQMDAVSQLFDQTYLKIVESNHEHPTNMMALSGHNLRVLPLPEPANIGFWRKVLLLIWLPRHIGNLWEAIQSSDAVHVPVPGDVGFIGLLLVWIQRKPLFVRHCGTWGEPVTIADRLLLWILERIASGRNVVMATGGGERPPSTRNPQIGWIHSTTLTEAELERISAKTPWQMGESLHLATAGRVSRGKNMIDALRALPQIQAEHPDTVLHIVGDGEERARLEAEIERMGLQEAVVLHGNVEHDEVLRILQTCHLFLFPTKTKEGFPKAVLEALACGLPVVTTNVSVLPYLIGSERGVILHEVSAGAVASAVLDILSDPHSYEKMVQSAQTVAHEYTLERWQAIIAERLEAAWGQPLRCVMEEPTN